MNVSVSFEVFPPKSPAGIAQLATATRRLSAVRPKYISVTYGAGGTDRDWSFAAIDAVQDTVLTPLPGTGLFKRMQKDDEITFNDYPKDWEKYDFVDVVFNHKNMDKDVFFTEI